MAYIDRPGDFKQLRRLWFGLSVFSASLILHFVLYILQPDKTASTSLKALAVGFVVLTVVVGAFTLWLNPSRLQWLRGLLARLRWPVTMGGLLALAVFGLNMRPEWIYTHSALTLVAAFSLLYWTLYKDMPAPHISERTILFGLAGLIAVVTLVRLAGLAVSPYVFSHDEGLLLGWTKSFMEDSPASDPMLINGGWLMRYYILVAEWMKLVGFGWWQGRAFSLLMSLLVMLFGTLAARNLYDRRTANFTLLVLLASSVLHLGLRLRHDIGLGVVLAASLWLVSWAQKRPSHAALLHLVGGLLVGLGAFAHYHATFFGGVMVIALYAPPYIKRLIDGKKRPETGVWFYIVGGIVGAVCVYLLQVRPDLQYALAPRTPFARSLLLTGFTQYVFSLAMDSQFEFILLMLAFGVALFRRHHSDWTLLLVVGLTHLILPFVASIVLDYYLVPLAVFYAILIARLFTAGFGRRFTSPVSAGGQTVVVVTFAACITIMLASLLSAPLQLVRAGEAFRQYPDGKPVAVDWIQDNLTTNQMIVADHVHFIWLSDYNLKSPQVPSYMWPEYRAPFDTDEDVWAAVNPDVFIFDPNLSTYGLLDPLLHSGFLPEHGYELVATLPGEKADALIYQRLPDEE